MNFKQSKFIFNADTMQIVEGKAPKKAGVLYKGESTTGKKMVLVGSPSGDPSAHQFIPYWGW